MGIALADLNDRQRYMLDASARKSLGRPAMTSREAQEKFARGEEKKLQGLIANYLNLHGIWFTWQRTDKRATSKVGTPDFVCCLPNGMFLAIEAKAKGGTLSREQAQELSKIRASKGMAIVAFSLQDVIDALK